MASQVTTLSFKTNSVEETQALGRRVGRAARAGDLILLEGRLGAGKTAFTQGLAQGLGISEPVNSPTFVLLKQYSGRLPLYHFDLYRLSNIESTVLEEWAEFIEGPGVAVIEWADLAEQLLPREHLLLKFSIESDESRAIQLTGTGRRYAELLASPELCC